MKHVHDSLSVPMSMEPTPRTERYANRNMENLQSESMETSRIYCPLSIENANEKKSSFISVFASMTSCATFTVVAYGDFNRTKSQNSSA